MACVIAGAASSVGMIVVRAMPIAQNEAAPTTSVTITAPASDHGIGTP